MKKAIRSLFCMLMLAVVLSGMAGIRSDAEESDAHGFLVEAGLISRTNSDTYDVELSVASTQMDLEGTVRLVVETAFTDCAYDTAITLPQGSVKQFTVSIPRESLSHNANITAFTYVQVLDRKGNVLAYEEFQNLFYDGMKGINIGILSDSYRDLTGLDMGGDTIYFFGDSYPIKLHELDGDSLDTMLSGMTYLVIDRFHSDSLTAEQVKAVEDWVYSGGVLIVGTGQYAEDTLTGLDNLLGMEVLNVTEPEEYQGDYQENAYFSSDYEAYEWYYSDARELYSYAELNDLQGKYHETQEVQGYLCSEGSGAICVLPYALSEVGEMGNITRSYAYRLLDDTGGMSSLRYQSNSDSILDYRGSQLFSVLNSSHNNLNLTVLNIIVIAYVFVAGPVLYLVLRAAKRREMYWLAVPAAAFFFTVIIFFAGRGFEVESTSAFTISIARADGQGVQKTYLDCYNASHDEWLLRLKEGYRYAGQAFNQHYVLYDARDYYHHVVKDGNGLSLGASPEAVFEDVYFCAAGENPNSGSIDITDTNIGLSPAMGYTGNYIPSGKVVNRTEYDFEYVGVALNGKFFLYGALPAGEQMDLSIATPLYMNSVPIQGDFLTDYIYGPLDDAYSYDKDMEEAGRLAALGLGVAGLYQTETDFVVGLVENYDKVIDDNCHEVSYGCLYTANE